MITQAELKIYCLCLVLLAGSLSSCASSSSTAEVDRSTYPSRTESRQRSTAATTSGETAAQIALAQVGVPYRYGGNNRSGFDCSGLVQYSYAGAGVKVPRTTGQLWSRTEPVARSELQVGDLLFFSFQGKMSHVGMYIGEQQFVHAPSSGREVSVERLDAPYYARALVRAGRPR